jgi:hypothetical protein
MHIADQQRADLRRALDQQPAPLDRAALGQLVEVILPSGGPGTDQRAPLVS